ncbi:hypothetical protein H7F33_14845 [Pedobacter sp. PAMC26386]|nr:hypothetical protein H7F33_14845 [Pedobacter sp. PAMC26386]
MKKLLFIFLISIPFLTRAQNCNCGDNFKFVVERIKNNYPGYKDKVIPAKQQRFDFFTDSLQKAANSADKIQCMDICTEWLAFFKDKHIGFSFIIQENASKQEVRNYFTKAEKTSWNKQDFKRYLDHNKNKLDEMEGIWFSDGGNYEIGIVKDSVQRPNEFIGFIIKADSLNWMPGQVKIRIKKTGNSYRVLYYGTINHIKYYPPFLKTGDTFNLGYYGDWFKNVPKKVNKASSQKETDYNPSFKILDKETSLIILPNFAIHYKKAVDSIIEANKTALQNSKHLIIDIRNNSGGSTYTFEKLLPYIYTNPIYTDGGVVWATAGNIKDCYSIIDNDIPEKNKKRAEENLLQLKAHLGELYPLYPADTIKFDSVLKSPQRVSVLMNGNSASSAEHFILRAEQSKKVTLFGQNSSGAIDYTEIVTAKMPCKLYTVTYPAFRSDRINRRKLDNVGIAPNVLIPDSITDWVEFVRKYQKP